jgi:thiopurine S-methyltransferase
MDPSFWHARWQANDIGFHQPEYHALLQTYWPRLALPAGSAVFVPLCGKSLDMVWLAERGHRVIGAELSELAIDAFFAERALQPEVREVGSFKVKSAGPYEMWCGDIFDLPAEAVEKAAAVYDRAALIALPAELQSRYARTLKALLPTAPVLLITLDYDQSQMQGPPFSTPGRQVLDLFAGGYECAELECRDVLAGHPHFVQRGLSALSESAWLLQPS